MTVIKSKLQLYITLAFAVDFGNYYAYRVIETVH